VTKDILKPTKFTAETDDAFCTHLIDWDNKYHQILTWFRNTIIPSIAALFDSFDDAQGAWDMLASHYSSIDGSREYQIILDLYHLKQESNHTITDFFARMQFLWDQLALSDPAWKDPTDAQMYADRRDQHRLYQFLMALQDDFKLVRGQLLHRYPFPTFDQAVCELVREETRLSTLRSQHTPHTHPVLATPSPQTEHSDRSSRGPSKNRDNLYCRYCRRHGHTIDKCWRNAKSSTSAAAVTTTESASSLATLAAPSGDSTRSSLTLSPADFEAIINQVLTRSGNASSSVLSILLGKSSSWLFYSASYNHMTPYASFFTTYAPPSHTSLIHTANGSSMTIQTIGTVHTPSLSVPDVFHVPKLSFDLLSVGKLCELGYRLVFDSSSVYVQNPWTGQTLGTGRRVGRLFELSSLHLSIPSISAATARSEQIPAIPAQPIEHKTRTHGAGHRPSFGPRARCGARGALENCWIPAPHPHIFF
jgi:hypothetical protein